MPSTMPPQNTEADAVPVGSLVGGVKEPSDQEEDKGGEADGLGGGRGGGGEETASEGSVEGIPVKRWVMHGAVMFGREFCYAMETALVTPVLLQIGLPEQYYSLTWFLSPVLGLMFTPLIGSASDRCTLRWGRRRPFILALCVGTLMGVALFLNGSLIGLALGDEPGKQPIGIVLTVLGVVVLDFCADATEGPIRAYLLDVADTEEQDMALNIHAASAGLGGAVGYALGGLDWTHTFLGAIFKSQEQILFVFAAVLFSASVVLHLLSIEEQQYSPLQDRLDQESPHPPRLQQAANGRAGCPALETIGERSTMESCDLYDPYGESVSVHGDMDFLQAELVRSKSDSVLAMADATLDHLDHDALFLCHIEPSIFADHLSPYHGSPSRTSSFFCPNRAGSRPGLANIRRSSSTGSEDLLRPQATHHPTFAPAPRISRLSAFLQEMENDDGQEALLNNQLNEQRTLNGRLLAGVSGAERGSSDRLSSKGQAHRAGMIKAASTGAPMRQPRHRHTFYRQPSCTFSYYGRVGGRRYRYRRANAAFLIKPSRSMSDLCEVEARHRRANRQRNRDRHRSGNTNSSSGDTESEEGEVETSVKLLWLSMLKMPPELLRLCACHLLTWFSIIAEAVFFTDFMGQVIYHGDPTAPANSTLLESYHKGVQMGCWGLVIYAMTAATCSAVLQKYLDNFDLSIKVIYILGTLGFSIGTAVMAIFSNVYVSMVMISSMGIISMSICYCPYALLGQYHEMKKYIQHSPGNSRRGFGIDCAILSCQVYISQILVASALGPLVEAVGSVRVIPMVASGGSFLGFLTACFLVIYPTPNNGEGDSAKASEKQALTTLENSSSCEGAVTVVMEKPSFLKLTKGGQAAVTTTSSHSEMESAL
ncbi:solute carrier family 45 member 4-like [Oryzias latipes]|uniref:Solute carrier family 45 member 4 n=1 Tax=Oryzias latipes TaxID=8090 RepID=A0A3B3HTP9_ORYLA|nr:solute carrier family 45 member 4-like [Oryzias latipes]XP_023816106.1 solute carrier family 45 member 4-like [Oryzias latipes]XP_023816107.1 solute carrier family 45 member 4-like [Oryzias latipes]